MVGEPVNRFGDMMATTHTLGLEHRVVLTGTLSVTDMRLLYSHAAVFVFASLYEGFGMPVLEAMACGAPVITSNTTALPEVAGDAAVLVNPEDPEELADAIIRVLEDSALRATLKERGFERAKQFTWERAAQRTVAVYREICR
jgi:glycosyltransferase involved in cell wall biosynthesis